MVYLRKKYRSILNGGKLQQKKIAKESPFVNGNRFMVVLISVPIEFYSFLLKSSVVSLVVSY